MLSQKNPAPYHEPTATRSQQRHYVPEWKREEERRRDEELAAENRRRRLREIRAEVARRKESREAVERAQAEARAKPEAPLPQPSTIFTDWLPAGEIVSTLTEVEQAALTFAREQFRDGALVKDDADKIQYVHIMDFDSREVRDAFSRACIDAVTRAFPDAFEDGEVAA
jgi:hypothetical protein